MYQTINVTQEGPANALALNKDYNQVVIAGRNGKIPPIPTVHSSSPTFFFLFKFSRCFRYKKRSLSKCATCALAKT